MFRNAVIVLALAVAAPVSAQRVLFIESTGFEQRTAFLDLVTGESTPVRGEYSGQAVFTADGQYLIGTVDIGAALETRLRHVASGVETSLGVEFAPQVAHPRALAVFGTTGAVLARLDASGLRQWPLCGAGVAAPFQLSDDGTRLFTVCPSGHFIVSDSASGSVLRDTIIGAPGGTVSFAASPDASQVVVVRAVGPAFEVARVDAVSGATMRVRPFLQPLAVAGSLRAVPGGTHVIEVDSVIGSPGASGYDVALVDFESLDRLPGLVVPRALFNFGIQVTADGREAFVSTSGNFGNGFSSRVERFDLNSGSPLGSATAPGLRVLGVASRPHAPVSVSAQTTGRTVALSWQLPTLSSAATGYRLAIGSATGTIDLGSIAIGPSESFTATGVPPGRYFVRLHTVNFTGESPASAEVVIDVP